MPHTRAGRQEMGGSSFTTPPSFVRCAINQISSGSFGRPEITRRLLELIGSHNR